MKKILTMTAVLSLLSSAALADDFYAAANLGIAKGNVKGSSVATALSTTDTSPKKSMTPIMGEIALGTYLTPNIRTEFAGSFLTTSSKEIMTNLKLKTKTMNGMVNLFYDFGGSFQTFTPYVMGGVGYSRNDFDVTGTLTTKLADTSKSKGSIAFQIGFGADYSMTDAMKLGLGYRFRSFGSGKANFDLTAAAGSGTGISFKMDPVHMIIAGIRFDF